MAPGLLARAAEKRQNNYCDPYFDDCYGNSSWNRWGRWVALVVILGFFLILAFTCSCINSRRRRRAGLAPRYGTGWLAGKYNNNYQNQGYNQYNGAYAPAPPYSQSAPVQTELPYGGGGGNAANEGYYGQQSGIELQQPQSSYQPQYGREQAYEPPSGPPPGKRGDGIIR